MPANSQSVRGNLRRELLTTTRLVRQTHCFALVSCFLLISDGVSFACMVGAAGTHFGTYEDLYPTNGWARSIPVWDACVIGSLDLGELLNGGTIRRCLSSRTAVPSLLDINWGARPASYPDMAVLSIAFEPKRIQVLAEGAGSRGSRMQRCCAHWQRSTSTLTRGEPRTRTHP